MSPKPSGKSTLNSARSYAEWREAAIASDERTGKASWKRVAHSDRYDYRTIRHRLTELREIQESGDIYRLVFFVKEGLHGNMGGIGSGALYSQARFGTKELITAYIEEVAEALRVVDAAADDEISLAEKLELFERASICFGRSALMFSGAGSLGPFHLGVARALLEQGLLPNVLSGASAGSFVAAFLGTHGEVELEDYLLSSDLGNLFEELQQADEVGKQVSSDDLTAMIHSLIPDLTFEEAYAQTGRQINISVSPSKLHQRSRLLNAVTSPNVYIREAIMASCAIPGIFRAVTLAAKSSDGSRQPYVRHRTWVDGSVTDDQPSKRLARLYGVNHFISSQANPIVLWSLRDSVWEDTLGARVWDVYQAASKEWFKATYPFAMKATKNTYPLNVLTRFGYGVATQDYTADVNILPQRRFWSPSKLLAVLSDEETMKLIEAGERATWPKIEMIRNCTLISRTLDEILASNRVKIAESLKSQSKGTRRRKSRSSSRKPTSRKVAQG